MRILCKFLLLVSICFSEIVNLSAQNVIADSEQTNLQLYYNTSKLLGKEVDTLSNPLLYQTLIDWLGTPYKYSGNCKEGIDCSGFASMLYLKVYDIKLSQCAADIYKEVKPVKKNDLKEGDLVFFKIRKHRISHVGVYLNNNKFVHASVQNGVIVSDLDEAYYKKYFFKGGSKGK